MGNVLSFFKNLNSVASIVKPVSNVMSMSMSNDVKVSVGFVAGLATLHMYHVIKRYFICRGYESDLKAQRKQIEAQRKEFEEKVEALRIRSEEKVEALRIRSEEKVEALRIRSEEKVEALHKKYEEDRKEREAIHREERREERRELRGGVGSTQLVQYP